MEASWVLASSAGKLALGALLLVLTGCDEGPFLQTEELVSKDGVERYVGGSCMSVDSGNGMGGGMAPASLGAAGDAPETSAFAYSFSYEGKGKSMHFRLADGAGEILAERSYTAAFIESGRKDEVTADAGGQKLRFVHWGVPECRPIREPDPD